MNQHVLTAEDVMVIHERLCLGHKGVDIARDFAVSQQTVSAIRTGECWGHVTGIRPADPRAHIHRAVLVEDQVLEVDTLLKAGVPVAEVARRFGVAYQTVSNIRHGISWAWLTGRPAKRTTRNITRG
jgi:hypothetical protein